MAKSVFLIIEKNNYFCYKAEFDMVHFILTFMYNVQKQNRCILPVLHNRPVYPFLQRHVNPLT